LIPIGSDTPKLASAFGQFVKSYHQCLRACPEVLYFLPPYAPDLNSDEFVWQYAKTNGVARKPLKQNESLKERVVKDLSAFKAKPKLVRSFFSAPSVAYAKD